MADSTTVLDQLSASQSNKELRINELLDALSPASIFGRRAAATTGLTWGYYGGRIGGTSVANDDVALTGSQTNYVVVNRATLAVTVSTSSTNWDNTLTYGRLYKITTDASAVTAYEDHRTGTGGVLSTAAGAATAGRHAVSIMAGSMRPSVTDGCSILTAIASGSGQPDIVTINFDASTQEYAQFSIPMPKSWDLGTVTFKALWSHPATTTDFGVVWSLQAVALSNDDAMATSFGTAQTSTDTGGTTNDIYSSPESSAITIAGSPAVEDVVFFRLSRVTGNGSDTMAVDARLHGIVLYINTTADTDA